MLFNEPKLLKSRACCRWGTAFRVSVLFNEPKLLKYALKRSLAAHAARFSALQRAEIAEIDLTVPTAAIEYWFQCSSTSRNC